MRQQYDKILTLIPQPLPIESAPKDGTVVIGFGFHDYDKKEKMLCSAIQYSKGIWFRDNNGYGFTVSCYPTSWLPMPQVKGE